MSLGSVLGTPFAGRYLLHERLGAGGMGEVFRATDLSLARVVALKRILGGHDADPEARARFQREAKAAARLSHEHIVPVFDVGMDDRVPYLTMEWIRGGTLADVLRERGPRLPPAAAMRLVRDVARGLAHAHAHGVIHRDLKPANILLEDTRGPGAPLPPPLEAMRPRIADFGMARIERDRPDEPRTQSGVILGTVDYMAPEAANGLVHDVDALSDVYSLGSVLYHMVSGHRPYESATPMECLLRKVREDAPPVRSLRPELAWDVCVIVETAMSRDKRSRYPGANALADDLERCLSGEAIHARPPSLLERGIRRLRRHRAAAVAGVTLLCGLAVSGAALIAQRDSDRRAAEAREQRDALQRRLVEELRVTSALAVESTLLVRRAGGSLAEALRVTYAPLRAAASQLMDAAPTLGEPHLHLARMHRALQQDEQALEQATRALEKEPDLAEARYERVVLVCRQHSARVAQLRQEWQDREGQRLLTGRRMVPSAGVPTDAVLVAADSRATALFRTVEEDLKFLEATSSRSDRFTPAMSACARAYGLAWLRGRLAEAADEFERTLALDPRLVEAYEGLAGALLVERKWDAAIAVHSRGELVDRGYASFRVWRGRIRHQQALEQMAQGGDPAPAFRQAHEELASLLRAEPDERSWRLSAVQVLIDWAWWEAQRGLVATEQFEAAERHLTVLLGRDPDDAQALRTRGGGRSRAAVARAWAGGSVEEGCARALEDLERAAKLQPGDADTWRWIGAARLLIANERGHRGAEPDALLESAEIAYGHALRIEPGSIDAWFGRACARANRCAWSVARGVPCDSQFQGADADIRSGLQIAPDDANLLRLRGDLQQNWGLSCLAQGIPNDEHFRTAGDALDRALALAPGSSEAWAARASLRLNWAVAQSRAGGDPTACYESAIVDLGKALELGPKNAELLARRARIRLNLALRRPAGDGAAVAMLEAAQADAVATTDLQPALAEGWLLRGWTAMRLAWLGASDATRSAARMAAALRDLDRAIELNPQDAESRMIRGWVHFYLDHWGDAVSDFEASSALDPTRVPQFRQVWDQARLRRDAPKPVEPADK